MRSHLIPTGTTNFVEELKNALEGIRKISSVDVVRIEQLEMPLPADFDVETLSDAASIVRDALGRPRKEGNGDAFRVFWEASPERAGDAIQLLAQHNRQMTAPSFGFKLRTGGVTANAFPTSAEIARVLEAAAKHEVPIKFTAGLHHPVRMFREEVKTKMHGFLNVLGAGVLAREHAWGEKQIATMLQDEEAAAFQFTQTSFRWRDFEIGVDAIKRHRNFITSFGSCSFDEPREDLRALGLL